MLITAEEYMNHILKKDAGETKMSEMLKRSLHIISIYVRHKERFSELFRDENDRFAVMNLEEEDGCIVVKNLLSVELGIHCSCGNDIQIAPNEFKPIVLAEALEDILNGDYICTVYDGRADRGCAFDPFGGEFND